MKHTLSVLVENRPGVLARIAGLFSRRGYNIDSLAVGRSENPALARMTIVVEGDDRVIQQVNNQLDKLIEVVQVRDITGEPVVERELVLVKVKADPATRGEIIQIVDIFRAHIVDMGRNSLVIECTGGEEKINAFQDALEPFGIREVVRTGRVAMVRGARDTDEEEEHG
ncbi:MAG: acetolactate synthase small subunit [Clostridia bacterium]|nr:acetolactate synthase small subunit [Clostridia bacterium]MDH7572050.1 acetolactate synthase small subunit [Clostridia bacterium]